MVTGMRELDNNNSLKEYFKTHLISSDSAEGVWISETVTRLRFLTLLTWQGSSSPSSRPSFAGKGKNYNIESQLSKRNKHVL